MMLVTLFKVQLDIQKAALQDADLLVSQLLERTVGGSHQADIVCSVSGTLYKSILVPVIPQQYSPSSSFKTITPVHIIPQSCHSTLALSLWSI